MIHNSLLKIKFIYIFFCGGFSEKSGKNIYTEKVKTKLWTNVRQQKLRTARRPLGIRGFSGAAEEH